MKSRARDTLTPISQAELKRLGDFLRLARVRRQISIREMAERMMVSPASVVSLEKGSSSVSLAILFKALAVLGLEKKFADVISPDKDQIGLSSELRRSRSTRIRKKHDQEFDF